METRCPRCRAPVEPNWVSCNTCGLALMINCPKCGQPTFFGDYCQSCWERRVVECKKCRTVQPPVSARCIKCGKPLEAG
ncbi:MAG: hypothetical protein QXF52_04310 [Thermoproteota archaeon]